MRKTKHFSKNNKRQETDPLRSAQAAMEVLIIIGVLVIGVIIFGTFYFGNIGERSRGTAGDPGDYNQSDLEASYNKALSDTGVEQVSMSGGSNHSGGDTGYICNNDGECQAGESESCPDCLGVIGGLTCNNNGVCNSENGETTENCLGDCPPTVLFLNSLNFSSSPIRPFRDEEFSIVVSANTNYESLDLYQLDIFFYGASGWEETNFCNFNGVYASVFYDLGVLTTDREDHVTGEFNFSCHIEEEGSYQFKFYARPTGEIEPTIDGTIIKEIVLQNTQFISVWNNGITGSGMSEMDAIILPIHPEGTYDFYVDWGDGTTPTHITSGAYTFKNNVYYGPAKHIYTDKIDTHIVTITGQIDGFSFHYPDIGFPLDAGKIREISQWGRLKLGNSGAYFEDTKFSDISGGTAGLSITATDRLDLRGTTNLSNMFKGSYVSTIPGINEWDVSNVTDMSNMFYYLSNFNDPLDSWDVSNVTDMSNMFFHLSNFNQPLEDWDVSNVTDMSDMFNYASAFNQALEDWDVSNVTDMSGMFINALLFNQPLASWDVSNVTDMGGMFINASLFNQPLDSWDVSNVTNMSAMFMTARDFNQPLASWNTSNVTNMTEMFNYAISYNQNISSWNVNNVTDWTMIFDNCPILTEYKPPKFRP